MNPLLSAISRYIPSLHCNRGRIRTGHRQARRQQLCLEVLEDRTLLSPTISIAGATMNEIGSPSSFISAGSGGLQSPSCSVLGSDGNLYVASIGGSGSAVLRYNANSGAFVGTFVPAGTVNTPIAQTFGPDGDLYVAAGGTPQNEISQIMRFGPENEALFTVTNSIASTQPLTVNYATADGTAIAGINYTATSGTLTFAPGVTTETIRVPLLDSSSQTAPLTFTLTLSNPEAATLSRSQATATIAPSDQKAKFYVVNGALTPTSDPGVRSDGSAMGFRSATLGSENSEASVTAMDLVSAGLANESAAEE